MEEIERSLTKNNIGTMDWDLRTVNKGVGEDEPIDCTRNGVLFSCIMPVDFEAFFQDG